MAKKATSAVKENPKTSILGLIAILAAIGSVWAPPDYQSKIQASATIAASIGLGLSKDHDK